MRFRRDAPLVIVGAIALALAALAAAGNALFAAQMDDVEATQLRLMRAILESGLRNAEDSALARAELIATLPDVRAAFAARDRARLNAVLEAAYAAQHERHGVDQAMFATKDSVSFLRLNAPDKFDEDLAAFRPIIVATNKDQVPRKALALGRSGPAMIGIVPVFDESRNPIGVFEVGADIAPILDRIKAVYGLDATFFVKEKPLREISTRVSPEVLDEHNRVGEYLRFASTNAALAGQLVDGGDLAKVNGDPVQYARASAGTTYGIVLVALRNAGGESLGVVAATGDFSATRAAAGRALVQQVALAAFALVLLAGVVIVVIRGFVLRPLGRVRDGLAALRERREAPALARDGMGEELAAVADEYEGLRQQGTQP